MTVLCDRDIRERCESGHTGLSGLEEGGMVTPFRPELVQPASLDMLLGPTFRVYENSACPVVDLWDPASYANLTRKVSVDTDTGFVLHPGEFVLGSTDEVVRMPEDLVGRVEGKSSLGRLGLIVHATAGYIDPGFTGVITLEMTNLLRVPIVLHPGIPICQLSFHRLTGVPDEAYSGRYQGDRAVAASRYTV